MGSIRVRVIPFLLDQGTGESRNEGHHSQEKESILVTSGVIED